MVLGDESVEGLLFVLRGNEAKDNFVRLDIGEHCLLAIFASQHLHDRQSSFMSANLLEAERFQISTQIGQRDCGRE